MFTSFTALVFVLFLVLVSSEIVLESRIAPCSTSEDEDVLGVDPAKNPIRLASSFKGPVKFDLKLYSRCRRKLLLTLTLSSATSKTMVSNAIVIINHAKNSMTKKPSRFGLPIAVKLHQDMVFQKYPVKRLYSVNGKMLEEIMNIERNRSYSGCNNSPGTLSPTCGFVGGPGTEIAGFCCSCKDHKNNIQQRGGHRCDIPGKTEKQLASAHCLRPSPFHYNVYQIQQPELYHSMAFEVFVSEAWKNGSLTWRKMSASGNGVRVDTENDMAASGALQVSYRPHLVSTSHSSHVFNFSSQRLLVPVRNHHTEKDNTPEPLKGPAENQMLIVPKSMMSPHGAICDRVGTGIGAFLHQKEPCRQERNSCLKNQPFDLWKQDQGPRGPPSAKFKVSSFRASEDEIPPFADMSEELEEGSLYAEHSALAPTKVFIEMPADDIILLNPGYNAFIEYALTETGKDGAIVVVEVVNNEAVSASFSIELRECSIEIAGEAEEKLSSPSQMLGPLDAKYFYIDIYTADKITQKDYCYVLLVNEHGESIAAREVTFNPKETCICVHICKCSCEDHGPKCARLGDEGTLAAGLHLEVMTLNKSSKRKTTLTDRRMEWIMHFAVIIHVLIILIAVITWLVRWYQRRNQEEGDDESGSGGGRDEEEEEEEEEEYEMDENLYSARSTDGSEIILYDRGGKGKDEHQKHTSSRTAAGKDDPRRGQTEKSGSRVKFNDIPAQTKTSLPELTQNQSQVQISPSGMVIPEIKVTDSATSLHNGHEPLGNNGLQENVQTVQMLETDVGDKGGGGGGGQSLNNNDSFSWFNNNNNDSGTNSNSNIDTFYNFCASVSSSRTSFGTLSRRRRDQFSAYDFLPAPKHKGSGILD